MYHEPFRPQFHYSPPCCWMNDPNGLVYLDGEYHLFYQFNPGGLTSGSQHWGHAVSPDLVHWETLPIALYPDEHGTIWSGSAVIDTNNTSGFGKNAMVAIYSYNTQTQGVAYSTDRGRTWTKYPGNPVIGALEKDFRDPKVFWHPDSGQWVMVIAAGHEVRFFTSPNLREWTFSGKFAGGNTMGVWEVPDLFPLEIDGQTKWVLLVSSSNFAPAGGNGVQYFIGSFDGHTFTNDYPAATLWLDYGPDNYAGTTWSNEPNGKHIYIGWMNNWAYADQIPTSTWRGATTLPRELQLVRTPDGIRLSQSPIAALSSLRTLLGTWDGLNVSGELPLDKAHGRTLEIIADFEPGDATRFGIDVDNGQDLRTRIVYNAKQSQLLISRPATTANGEIAGFTPAFGARVAIDNGHVRFHLFVDESSVEVFANDGLTVLTSQTFVNPANDGVAVFAENGLAKLSHLEVYALASIWPKPSN
ncbi:MAG: glycoside hydrolase family 32 protein [Aggregatilineales bacterium]